MALSDFIEPFIIALVIHALVFSSGSMNHDAKIVPQKGASSVILNIVPSLAPAAAQTTPAVAVPEVSGRTTRAGKKETVHPIAEPTQPSKVKEPPASDRSVRANTAAQPHEERVQPEETIAQQEESAAEQIVHIEEDVTEKPLMLQKSTPAEVGDALDTKATEGDVKEQGVRVPASAVGLTKPVYPRFSRIHGEEGTVVLSVEVLADGNPGKIEIVSSSGYRRLDRAALKAIDLARFIAASIDGKAVDSTQRIAFRFDLYEPGGQASRAGP